MKRWIHPVSKNLLDGQTSYIKPLTLEHLTQAGKPYCCQEDFTIDYEKPEVTKHAQRADES
jgi:hypothetical protein